ncbi:MAG: hypothetical protein H0U75_04215 [Legionella sp.]|nr:hypothetical protein [Legionella sp.]
MSDLFEEDDVEDLEKIEVVPELIKIPNVKDARIRLEKKLDEKRLRDELNDYWE